MLDRDAVPPRHLEPTRITIEFDATEQVSGRVLAASGATDSFAGWLDLLTLLQSVHTDQGAAGDLVEPPR